MSSPSTTSPTVSPANSDREKRRVALTSAVAAVFLTGMKLVVGLSTHSLGILSEAAHSGLDLAAALVTLFAVRVSGRPADRDHTYGHGKVESLSALFETFLLLVTCAWIFIEAIKRLWGSQVHVDASWWAFVVMAISIAIDVSRSRALARVAKRYHSQALEADALHFATDVWSSSVVIGGLMLVWLSHATEWKWLQKADAVAALAVAGIVVHVSIRLGRRSAGALLDGIAASTRDLIFDLVLAVPGVQAVERLRVRQSGPESFADVTLRIGRDIPLEQAHQIVTGAEAAVRQVLPDADVVVQVNPVRTPDETLLARIRIMAARHNLGAHGIRLYDAPGQRTLELHLEVDDTISLTAAHALADAFEAELRQKRPDLTRVVTHLEPIGVATTERAAVTLNEVHLLNVLHRLPRKLGLDFRPHAAVMHLTDGQIALSFHCVFPPDVPITEAHALTEQIEKALRAEVPQLGRVVIHVEPQRGGNQQL